MLTSVGGIAVANPLQIIDDTTPPAGTAGARPGGGQRPGLEQHRRHHQGQQLDRDESAGLQHRHRRRRGTSTPRRGRRDRAVVPHAGRCQHGNPTGPAVLVNTVTNVTGGVGADRRHQPEQPGAEDARPGDPGRDVPLHGDADRPGGQRRPDGPGAERDDRRDPAGGARAGRCRAAPTPACRVTPRNSDNITNNPTPDFTGTVEPGATVALFVNGKAAGTTTADAITGVYVRHLDVGADAGAEQRSRSSRPTWRATPAPRRRPWWSASTRRRRRRSRRPWPRAATPARPATTTSPSSTRRRSRARRRSARTSAQHPTPQTDGTLVQIYVQLVVPAGQPPAPTVLAGEALADPLTGGTR